MANKNLLIQSIGKEAKPKISKSQAIKAMRRRLQERPGVDERWKLIWDFDLRRPQTQHNDRALALVLGAILEQSLETAILTHCIKLDDTEVQKLWSGEEDAAIPFAIKVRLGFALGIYGPDSRNDLTMIRHIRNLFAHTKTHISFGTNEVNDLCDQIKWPDKLPWGGQLGEKPETGREIYTETVRHYFVYFESRESRDSKPGAPMRYITSEIPELYA